MNELSFFLYTTNNSNMTSIKRHTGYYSTTLYLAQVQYTTNLAVSCDSRCEITEGGKWNSHQMLCAYSSRMVKNYCICPIRIEIIHGRHRVVQIYTYGLGLYILRFY